MTFGSLFAGIGGFDLGFERAGMRCVWQVEIDPYCRRVLAKHWPNVRRHDDVRTWPTDDAERPDVICGGFPCQDISSAGDRAGIEGERSGLWTEFARIVRVLRPAYVVVENVPGLLVPIIRDGRRIAPAPIGRVLGDLAAGGNDAEWDCIPASAVGADHQRDRVFIVAYPRGIRLEGSIHGRDCNQASSGFQSRRTVAGRSSSTATLQNSNSRAVQPRRIRWGTAQTSSAGWWSAEPSVGRVANGIPDRLDRLSALGNAVVPQVAEWIGRRLMEADSLTPSPEKVK